MDNQFNKRISVLRTSAVVTLLTIVPFASQSAELKFGMSTALSGPASALGNGVKLGVETAFNEVNQAGGINGNTLKLVSLDDGYEPKRAAPNMRKLAEDASILGVIGNVGTPTAIVSVPIANKSKTPFIGAFTGAGVLRNSPPDRYIFNYRASYAEETSAMINGLIASGISPEEIGFFTQNDGYGDAGFNGAVKALNAKGFSDIESLTHGRYERNTKNVEDAAEIILSADTEVKAVIMVGAYAPCAEFIKLIKEELPDVHFLNVSFVGSQALKRELGDQAEGVVITQVVPHFEATLQGVEKYRTSLKLFSPDASPDFVSLEGYLAAKLLISGLLNISSNVDRESLISGLEKISNFDLGIGPKISYDDSEHQASHNIWPTIVKNGAFHPLKWSEL